MVGDNYYDNLSLKTKILNLFRRVFKVVILENLLQKFTSGRSPSSFYAKFVPMEYLYESPSTRLVQRHGVKFELDISQVVDHFIYFDFSDKAFNNLLKLVKESFVVVDVGANIGRFSLFFAKKASDGHIICFEPDVENFNKLKSNFSLNGFNNMTLTNSGLGSKNEILKLFNVSKNNSGMNRIIIHEQNETIAFKEIEVLRLDDFLIDSRTRKIDLIKIDVEGFELEVIKGARKSILEYRPILFIEINDSYLKTNKSSALELIKYIESMNYVVLNGNSMQPITVDDIKLQIDVLCFPN